AAAAAAAQAVLATVYELLSDASTALSKAITNQTVTAAVLAGYVTDTKNARESVNGAIASLATATAALDASTKTLAVKRAGSTSADIAAQAAQVKAAAADVANARAALGKTLIFAPFAGTVSNVEVTAGETATANSPVLSLIGRGAFQIETYVPEVSIAAVKTGDRARVTLEAYGKGVQFDARVVSIDPAETVKDGISTYKTILRFSAPDPRIRSGMTANTVIETSRTENAIVVPRGAVYEADGKHYVHVVSGGEVSPREVELAPGGSLGQAEVTEGLSEGEVILLAPER
ncbi:MAG: efflux RND transporter periplasmic adaptor subunit, partial [bacterium]|nr:efflux RND transporter periplasmic adaptor subunit [bacterium]